MSVIKKALSVVLVLFTMLGFCLAASAAATEEQDGLVLQLSTDKSSYESNEPVKVIVSVTNTNNYAVENVSIKNSLPDGFKINDGYTETETASLGAGKSMELSYTAVINDNNTSSEIADEEYYSTNNKLGNIILLVLCCIILVASGIGIFTILSKNKKPGKSVFSILLCFVILLSISSEALYVKASAQTIRKSFYVAETFVLNGNDFNLRSEVGYDFEVKTENKPQPVEQLNNNVLYSPNEKNIAIDDETGIMYMNNMIIVVFSDNATQAQKDGLVAELNGKVVGKIDLINQYQIEISIRSLAALKSLITKVEAKEYVLFAHYDRVYEDIKDSVTINDPWNGDTNNEDWNDNDVDGSNWWLEAIEAPKAWENNRFFSHIKIGIVDNGFDTNHQDLTVSFPDDFKRLNSKEDHGTHVAGIIGATANNDKGITGIVWNKELICFDWEPTWIQKIVHKDWSTDTMVYAGLIFLVEADAKVINFSLGASDFLETNNDRYDQSSLDEEGRTASAYMAQLLKTHDFIVVQSAGNGAHDGIGIDAINNGKFASVTSENCWNIGTGRASKQEILNRIIVVAASDVPNSSGYSLTSFSNGGSQVDIAAPGESVYSTVTGGFSGSYESYPGTSMAAPIVTGVASLVWSVNKNFTGAEVRNIVCGDENTSITVFDNSDSENATGNFRMVNAKLAVEKAISLSTPSPSEEVRHGTLSGKICKASDRSVPVANADIRIYKDSSLVGSAKSDANGNYSVNLSAGDYLVRITADGYLEFKSYATVTADENTYMETFLMVQGEEGTEGVAQGTVVNALTGIGVEGVTLSVKNHWNNLTGQTITTCTTDSDGNYSLTLPIGNYTLVASKQGYVNSSFNIIVQAGVTDNQNGTVSPVVSGDDFLITLTWGENPRDLDAHVVGTLSDGDTFHVYYSHKTDYDGDIEVCNLDVDDRYSFGPEHITLKTTSSAPYYYYVRRYAGSGTLASSEAKVTVHQGNVLIAEFNVPTNLGNDDYWNVFAIKDGNIIVKNTITDYADTRYAD